VRNQIIFQQPQNLDMIGRQVIFWNGELLDSEGSMFRDQSYAFRGNWMNKSIRQIKDLWDYPRQDWQTVQHLTATLGTQCMEERRNAIIRSIPNHWCMRRQVPFNEGEWVATQDTHTRKIDSIFQIQKVTAQGLPFNSVGEKDLFQVSSREVVDISAKQLVRIRVTTTLGNLKTL
jgi:hypothetical protein